MSLFVLACQLEGNTNASLQVSIKKSSWDQIFLRRYFTSSIYLFTKKTPLNDYIKHITTDNIHADWGRRTFLGAWFAVFEDFLADCIDVPALGVAKDFASGFLGVFFISFSFIASFGMLSCLVFFCFDEVCRSAHSSVTLCFGFGVSRARGCFFLLPRGVLFFLPRLSRFSGLGSLFCI